MAHNISGFQGFDFRDLFVLDMANNHQGQLQHGLKIIDELKDVVSKHGVKAGIKFQFRDLSTFVHPGHRETSPNKHVSRFASTRLDWNDYATLHKAVKQAGMLSICTPFDEASVARIVEIGFDILKIASCSANDWPLLGAAADSGLPIIASTGGLLQEEMDALVSFLDHRGCDYALMHCVSIYPTPAADCNLGNIGTFKQRYPNRVIGWSTHEDPDEIAPVLVARAAGAEMFERHVGVVTEDIKLNAYSSTPAQVDAWIGAMRHADELLGNTARLAPVQAERDAIDGLKRGIFAKRDLPAGTTVSRDDVYFAFPYDETGLSSGEWAEGMVLDEALTTDEPLRYDAVTREDLPEYHVLKKAVHNVRARLNIANIPLTSDFSVEFSHHYGIRNFNEVGTVMVNVINRDYCKKVLVQLPGQQHPLHYHKLKEETFLVLSGTLYCELDGRRYTLQRGDTLLVLPGVWHRFWTEDGAIFEEISTTHYKDDSVYRDARINEMSSAQRKTIVDHWGRFQIQDQLRNVELPGDLIEIAAE